jgi:hypothetical protein
MSSRRPSPYRRYTGLLKEPFRPGDTFTTLFEEKFEALLAFYGIAWDDPERQAKLLVCLMHRSVPGFHFHQSRRPKLDDEFIIQTIDSYKDAVEERTGKRPSTRAAVKWLRANELPDSGLRLSKMSVGNIMRIYSDRKKRKAKWNKEFDSLPEVMRKMLAAEPAPRRPEVTAYVRYFRALLRQRYG